VIVFIHTLGVTRSYLLPLIRSTLLLDSRWSDQEIIRTFTLTIPGHIEHDAEVSLENVHTELLTITPEMAIMQKEIAHQLLLSHPREIITTLNDKKITLIGHGFGAMVALTFLFYHFSNVRRVALISCGNYFNAFALWRKKLSMLFISGRSRSFLTKAIARTSEVWKKSEYSLFSENLNRKGYFSVLELMQSFQAHEFFDKLSLDDQLKILRIPILSLLGSNDSFVSAKSILSLSRVFNVHSPVIQLKSNHANIGDHLSESSFSTHFYPEAGHFLPETNTEEVSQDIQLFLRRK